jgi:hypothetical protein
MGTDKYVVDCVGPDNLVYVANLAGGLRIVDVNNPFQPREVRYFVPGPAPGYELAATNGVFVEDGLIYLIDRWNGLVKMAKDNPCC